VKNQFESSKSRSFRGLACTTFGRAPWHLSKISALSLLIATSAGPSSCTANSLPVCIKGMKTAYPAHTIHLKNKIIACLSHQICTGWIFVAYTSYFIGKWHHQKALKDTMKWIRFLFFNKASETWTSQHPHRREVLVQARAQNARVCSTLQFEAM
jgi:hypothetical protein